MGKKISIIHGGTVESVLSLACAAAGLRSLNQDATIRLFTEEQCLEAAALIPGLDEVQVFDESAIGDSITYWIGCETQGSGSSESREWTCYSEMSLRLRMGNPFHQVDLHRKALSVDAVDSNFELLRKDISNEALQSLIDSAQGLKVAVCASTLCAEEINAIIEGLLNISMPCELFCVGTVKDRKTSGAVRNQETGNVRFHDLCGHVSLQSASELLRACDMAVVGPGTTALLASGHGTFSICIDRSPERGPLHYPYGHGHIVLQYHQGKDFSGDLPKVMHNIVQFAVSGSGGMLPNIDQWQQFFETDLSRYLGKVRISATQRVETRLADGTSLTEFHLKPLVFLGAEYFEAIQSFYRLVWELSFSGRNVTTYDLQILHQDTIPSLCELLKPLEQVYELAGFGSAYSTQIQEHLSKGEITRAKKASTRLQEVDDLIQSMGTTYTALEALCGFHLCFQSHIDEDNPILLAREMKQSFQDLRSRVLVLLDLNKTLFHTNLRNDSAFLKEFTEEGVSDG